MVSAGQTTITTVGTTVFEASHSTLRATVYSVGVTSTSSYGALVRVEGLHEADEFFPIEVGQRIEFKEGVTGIANVFAKGDQGDCVLAYGIVTRTYPRMRGSV